jgi:hypothetical protein
MERGKGHLELREERGKLRGIVVVSGGYWARTVQGRLDTVVGYD